MITDHRGLPGITATDDTSRRMPVGGIKYRVVFQYVQYNWDLLEFRLRIITGL